LFSPMIAAECFTMTSTHHVRAAKTVSCRAVGPANTRMFSALLSFGSNLGDRYETLKRAWCILGQTESIKTVRFSPFYETEPVGGPTGQPMYINAAGIIQTTVTPTALLGIIQKIESAFGRIRAERWGARTLDIDILLYEDQIIDLPTLTIPHAEMLHRQFVLLPAYDIAGEWIHPCTRKTIHEHCNMLKTV